MRYGFGTFGDIVRAVAEQVRVQLEDTGTMARIRRNVNTVYLHHVLPASNWDWLKQSISLANEPYFEAGDAAVTQNSFIVTLTQSPAVSKAGHYFSVNTDSEVYRIANHAAGSNTLILETAYAGTTLVASKYKIWTDKIPLPIDCMQVTDVVAAGSRSPLQNVSMHQLRKHQVAGGAWVGPISYFAEGAPEAPEPYISVPGLPLVVSRSSAGLVKTLTFDADVSEYLPAGSRIRVVSPNAPQYTGDFPVSYASGTQIKYTSRFPVNETDVADAQVIVMQDSIQNLAPTKHLYIHPSLQSGNRRFNLHVDYVSYAPELLSDTDEPLIPLEYRRVLFEGAMWLTCDRDTDSERAEMHRQLMEQTLQRMMTKEEITPKTPTMRASTAYFRTKRMNGARSAGYYSHSYAEGFPGGQVTNAAPTSTGTPNSVAVFDENGYLIGSDAIDLTALEFLVGAQGGLTATIPASSTITVDSFNATQYKGAQVAYVLQRGTVFERGTIDILTDGSAAWMAGPVGVLDDTGVEFTVDIFAGEFRLRATADGVGPTATMSYRVLLF